MPVEATTSWSEGGKVQVLEIRNRESGFGIWDSGSKFETRNSKLEKPVLSSAKDRQSSIVNRQSAINRDGRETVRVLMVAGGTGGHIFPALVVAEELRRRSEEGGAAASVIPALRLAAQGREPVRPSAQNGPERSEGAQGKLRRTAEAGIQVEFLGTTRALENRLIPSAGFTLHAVHAQGLKGIGGLRRLQNFMVLPRSTMEAARVLKTFQPQVVVGVGGYISGPVMLEAALKDIPTLLIEPNALAGFTTRALGPVARGVAVAFEETAACFGTKARLTGCPVRPVFHAVAAKDHKPPWTLLVMGGSQGSRAINECVREAYPILAKNFPGLRLIHQTGEKDYAAARAAYEQLLKSGGIGGMVDARAFFDDVPRVMAEADIVISRSGAVSVAEIAAAGKAAIFVPFPQATDQHQLANARALEKVGGARIIEQRNLTPARLAEEVEGLLSDTAALRSIEHRARATARPDAAARIADWVEKLAGVGL
jgi:UDP-N-acetylglucosamine--N-acetylmuramyl-(pentapeptide) pyrophosphoryl-undecaprenol N-acetylglucosamine transferase